MNIQRILIIKCTYKKIQLPCTFPSIYMFTTLYSILDEKQYRVEDTLKVRVFYIFLITILWNDIMFLYDI